MKTLYLYGELGWTVNTGDLIREIDEAKAEGETSFELRINSPGGDLFQGIALYNRLRTESVEVVIDGICASAATLPACAGQVKAGSATQFMIHNPVVGGWGDETYHKRVAENLEALKNQMADIYVTKTGKDKDEIIEAMDKETWFNPTEAEAFGFVDVVDEEIKSMVLYAASAEFRDAYHKLFLNKRYDQPVITFADEEQAENWFQRQWNKFNKEDQATNSNKPKEVNVEDQERKELTDRITALEKENNDLKEFKQNAEAKEEQATKDKIEAFLDGPVFAKKYKVEHREGQRQFLNALANTEAPVMFKDDNGKDVQMNALDYHIDVVVPRQPDAVKTSEKPIASAETVVDGEEGETSAEEHVKAIKAYAKENNLTFREASRAYAAEHDLDWTVNQ